MKKPYSIEIIKKNPSRRIYSTGGFRNWLSAFFYAVRLGRAARVMGFFWPTVKRMDDQ